MLGIQHEAIGGTIGLIFSVWLLYTNHPIIAIAAFLIAICGANLPDLIDPPTNPFHRSIGHNWISFILFIILSSVSVSLSIIFNWWPFILVASFALSLLSHLILDLMTPMGLPLFTGKSLLGIIEIPLFMIPIINIIMVIVTIFFAFYSIKYISKKIGGKTAMILLFIPVWGTFLLSGIALKNIFLLSWLGNIFLFIFLITVIIILLIGQKIDEVVKKSSKKRRKH